MILLPDADGTVSFHWVLVGSGLSDRWEALVDDNGDTSYVQCDNDSAAMIIEFANPDDVTSANSGVAEAEIDTITSVRFISSGRSANRRNAALVDIDFQVPSGNPTESCSYDPHVSSHERIEGTAREHSDGSSANWTYADLESLEMKCTKVGNHEVYLGYLAIEVTYTEAVTTNATFFGANF